MRYSYVPNIDFELVSAVDFSGTGDGYRVIPYTLKIGEADVSAVFIINHHWQRGYIKCKVATDGRDCPGWESGFSVPKEKDKAMVKADTMDVNGNVDSVWTSLVPTEYLDRKTGKLYFPVGTLGPGFALRDTGILCADLVKKKSCGFTKTGAAFSTKSDDNKTYYAHITGLGTTDDLRLLSFQGSTFANGKSQVHCFDIKTESPCPGQPYAHTALPPSVSTEHWQQIAKTRMIMSATTYGDYTFMTSGVEGVGSYLSCFNNRTNASCAGFDIKTAGTTKESAWTDMRAPLPILAIDGALKAVCMTGTGRGTPIGQRAACYALNGDDYAPPAGSDLAKWIKYQTGFEGASIQTYVTSSKKAYNFDVESNKIICYDFAKNEFCFGKKTGVVKTNLPENGENPFFYAITEDPEREGCVWALGHASISAVWDETTGEACAQRVVTQSVDTVPSHYYGFDKTVNGDVSYQKVVIRNLGNQFVDTTAGKGVRATVYELLLDGKTGTRLVDNQALVQSAASGDYVLDLTQFSAKHKGELTYKKYPRLRTVITVYRDSKNPAWPPDVQGDMIWSGPAVQFSVQTKAPVNNANACLANSYVQSGVFTASSTLNGKVAETVAKSNALTEGTVAAGSSAVALETRYLGYTRASPQTGEGLPTVAMSPSFDNNTFTGNIGFYDVTSGTPGAADPTHTKLADVHGLTRMTESQRTVYTTLASGKRAPFQWDDLDDAFKDALDRDRSGILDGLGKDRVAYLRGDRSKEVGRVGSNGVFHARSDRGTSSHASTSLEVPDPGAMTGSGLALMLRGVLSGYSEALAPGYAKFYQQSRDPVTGRRLPVVFASSNDGFLYAHTVAAGSGQLQLQEAFTYLPRRPMSLLSGYTDRGFGQLGAFPYLNDGAPMLADVCMSGCGKKSDAVWRTVLVSSFGRAFAGGYAIDVTDVSKKPEVAIQPVKSLWEFTDKTPVTTAATQPDPAQHLGKQSAAPLASYSNASLSTQVARVKVDGKTRWAWIIGNGYGSPASDAASMSNDAKTAVLYVVFMDGAESGHPQYVGIKLPGTAGAANGLSTPNPVDVNNDGAADLVYAGDLQGNLWRIDLTGLSLTKALGDDAAQVIMRASNGAGTAQPIVGAPAVVSIGNAKRMVVFSSGRPEVTDARYLDNADALYSLIGLQDAYAPGSADPNKPRPVAPERSTCTVRTLGNVDNVKVKIKTGPKTFVERWERVRPIAGKDMDTKTCWALDLGPGETGIGNAVHNPIGNIVDLQSIEPPTGNSCTPGKSWFNRVDALTGKAVGFDVNGDGFISSYESSLGGVSRGRTTQIRINNGGEDTSSGHDKTGLPKTNSGRVSWREL